uniref:Uncharacterized protein n=1 Tax=viral metagenome TaxID=1070528 RepID=A0A6M3LMC7_9ZZZZ
MVMSRASAPLIRSGRTDFNALTNLALNTRILWVPTNAGWTAAVTGSGATEQFPPYNNVYTGATGSSTSRLYTAALRHDQGASSGLDFTKRMLWAFSIVRIASDAEVVARVQLKAASTEGALGAAGIGIQISNLTLVGESYNAGLSTTGTLATLTVSQMDDIVVVCDQPNSKVDFYVNQVLVGSITTAANIPSGNVAVRMICSIIRGATGATDSYLQTGNILVATEY